MNKKIKKIIVMAACAALACVTLGGCAIKDEANNWLDQILCDHEYDEGEVTKEATCVNKGEITYTCEECGKTKTEKTDKLPHVEKEIEVAATCQETGLTEGVKCVVCEEILVYPKVVAKLAHMEIITSAELAATCTTAGQTKGSHCGVCNEVLSVSEGIPALGHDYVDNLCSRCGSEKESPYKYYNETAVEHGTPVAEKVYRFYKSAKTDGDNANMIVIRDSFSLLDSNGNAVNGTAMYFGVIFDDYDVDGIHFVIGTEPFINSCDKIADINTSIEYYETEEYIDVVLKVGDTFALESVYGGSIKDADGDVSGTITISANATVITNGTPYCLVASEE